jgi:hypothetical protein
VVKRYLSGLITAGNVGLSSSGQLYGVTESLQYINAGTWPSLPRQTIDYLVVAGGGAGVASVGGVCAVAAKAIPTVPDASNCLRVEGIEHDCMGEIHFGAIGEPQPPTRR